MGNRERRCVERGADEIREFSGPEPAAAADETEIVSLKEMERRHILHVLEHTDWHKGKACEILGISRPKLQRHIEEFGLTPN